MEKVVRAWSARLNAGDNAGIARLFSLPAVLIQGPYVYRLVTRHQVELWHSGLPCSGRIVSITYRGRFATVVFRLGNRGATKCDQPGSLAAEPFQLRRRAPADALPGRLQGRHAVGLEEPVHVPET